MTVEDDRPGASWRAVDLVPALEGKNLENGPTMLARNDGVNLFYEAKVHSLAGEPESGKGWLALYASAEQILAGEHVVYIDFEGEPETAVERLRAQGLTPTAIEEQFHYLKPDEPLDRNGWEELQAVLTPMPRLVVIDGVTDALALHGIDIRDNTAISNWLRHFPRKLARLGMAVVLIDHVTKSREGRGRYQIGGQHKLAGIDVAYVLQAKKPLGRGLNGLVAVSVEKDRLGHIRKFAEGKMIAQLQVRSNGDTLNLELTPANAKSTDEDSLSSTEAQIIELLGKREGLSANSIREQIEGKNERIDRARHRLVDEGTIRVQHEGRKHLHFLVRRPEDEE